MENRFTPRVGSEVHSADTGPSAHDPVDAQLWLWIFVGKDSSCAALAEAKRRGAVTVDLTSRPSREAANRLYQRLGFVARETNMYRFKL